MLLFSGLEKIGAVEHRADRAPIEFHIGLKSAPFIAVLLLVATTSIKGPDIRYGIVGDEGIRMYNVIAVFLVFVGGERSDGGRSP